MAKTQIYALSHPETGEIRYIGKANSAKKRHAQHIREAAGSRLVTPLYCWMRTLGAPPTLSILEECDPDVWEAAEIRLIAEHRASGRLLNLADGGNQPQCSTAVRAANGRANAKALHSDPLRKRVWEVKRALGLALKRGHVNEATKAKMRAAAVKYPQFWGEWATI